MFTSNPISIMERSQGRRPMMVQTLVTSQPQYRILSRPSSSGKESSQSQQDLSEFQASAQLDPTSPPFSPSFSPATKLNPSSPPFSPPKKSRAIPIVSPTEKKAGSASGVGPAKKSKPTPPSVSLAKKARPTDLPVYSKKRIHAIPVVSPTEVKPDSASVDRTKKLVSAAKKSKPSSFPVYSKNRIHAIPIIPPSEKESGSAAAVVPARKPVPASPPFSSVQNVSPTVPSSPPKKRIHAIPIVSPSEKKSGSAAAVVPARKPMPASPLLSSVHNVNPITPPPSPKKRSHAIPIVSPSEKKPGSAAAVGDAAKKPKPASPAFSSVQRIDPITPPSPSKKRIHAIPIVSPSEKKQGSATITDLTKKLDPTSPSFSPVTKLDPTSPPFEPVKKLDPTSPPFSPAMKLDPTTPPFEPAKKLDPTSPAFSPLFKLDPTTPPFEPEEKSDPFPIVSPTEVKLASVPSVQPKIQGSSLTNMGTATSNALPAKPKSISSTPWAKKMDSTQHRSSRPNPMTPLKNSATPKQYYAGPGFLASPSASSLKKPRVLSKPVSERTMNPDWRSSPSTSTGPSPSPSLSLNPSPSPSPKSAMANQKENLSIPDRRDDSPTLRKSKPTGTSKRAASEDPDYFSKTTILKLIQAGMMEEFNIGADQSGANSPWPQYGRPASSSSFSSFKAKSEASNGRQPLPKMRPMSEELRKQKALELTKYLEDLVS